jgi:bifunctional UDP-N-acetylglucosamine pyrophosphorylase / glucosamine-1-phosphate N-acetyltransferase
VTQPAKPRAAIILAAGKGTRMKSELPKVMHAVAGRPMVDWSVALAKAAGCTRIIVVAHPSQHALIAHIGAALGPDTIVYQDPPMGTGHAVRCAEAALADFDGDLVVLYGDSPLVPVSAIEDLFAALSDGASVGVLGFQTDAPGQYGRLIEAPDGTLSGIVEAREASPAQLAVKLCNSGVMAADARTMFSLLQHVTNQNAKGEYYLTDLVGLAQGGGRLCRAVRCGEDVLIGCDSKADLAEAEAIFQAARRTAAMIDGVTLIAPDTVWFAYDTDLAPDVVIEPNVFFGPGVRVETGARICAFSHIEGAHIGRGAQIGPFARLRPGTELGADVRIGNFVEVKKTRMGAGAKANHLAYLGDGHIGDGANIGAGTIFCNYDGFSKFETRIGNGAFVGSNSSLVAPVTIGDGAYIGSGSVITKDVNAEALAVARGDQREIAGWATQFRARRKAEKAAKAKGKPHDQ